jgi:mono/diheme cytochrome c family protein
MRLFVHNFMARSLSVLDLSPLLNAGQFVATTLATPPTVGTEKLAANVLRGKQLFYDARDPRLARDSYMSCASCHNDGGHDGRVWDLTHAGEGLRNTISLRGRAGGQGRLHWSANFDEVQDFEAQIRSLAGGRGLMADAQFNAGTRSQSLGDAKAGLSADLDALAAYVASLNTFDNSPARQANGALTSDAVAGRAVFQAQCASCHAGTDFTDSSKKVLHNVGTQKAASGQRLGLALNGLDAPTLRDVWATAPYLHDGSAATLQDAVVAHGLNLSAADLAAVVSYTRQIGAEEGAPTPGTANLVVRAFSTLLDRVGAWFEVRVDGRTVGSGQIDATSPVDLIYNVAALVRDAVIDVVFKNDGNSATEDRNMVVQSVRVNGNSTINATDAGVTLDQGVGGAAFDGLDTLPAASTGGWMPWDSAMRFRAPATPGGNTVTVRVASTLAAGVGANVELRVNGVLVGSRLLNTTAVQDLVFTTPVVRSGDRIDVVFTNDAVIRAEDRNLFVQTVTARGTVLSPTAAGVLIDRGSGAQAWDGLDTLPASTTGGWLFWNAALRLVAR